MVINHPVSRVAVEGVTEVPEEGSIHAGNGLATRYENNGGRLGP